MTRTVLVLAIGAVLVVGCGSGTAATAVPTPVSDPSLGAPTSGATDEPAESATSEASAEAPTTFAVGDVVIVTKDDVDWAQITVTEASTVPEYEGELLTDTPAEGNVYLQVFVRYEALSDGVAFNTLDWDLFVDDVIQENFTFVTNGPEPTLSSGQLPEGRIAEGWMVFEIPAEGEAVLSWKGITFFDDAPVFEVVVREA